MSEAVWPDVDVDPCRFAFPRYAFQCPWPESCCPCTRSQLSWPLGRAMANCVLVSLRDDDSQAGLVDLHRAVRLAVKMDQLWQEQELTALCARLRISHRSWPGEPPYWVHNGYGPPALVHQAYRLERSYQASCPAPAPSIVSTWSGTQHHLTHHQ